MATTFGWTERTDGQDSSIDTRKAGQSSRRFILDVDTDPTAVAYKPETILGGGNGNEPLPTHGSAHPIYPALKLDRYQVEREGLLSVAVALYSNDGRFQYPEITDPQEEGEVRYQSGREDVNVEVPVIVTKRVPQALPPQFVGPPEAFDGYAIDFISVRETRRKRMWTVLLKTDQVQLAEDRMDAQNNRLHKLLGRWYRFQAGDIIGSGVREYPYQTTYTWWYDRGSKFKDEIVTPGVKLPPIAATNPFGATLMHRPPFHEFVTSQNNDASVEPAIGVWCPYDYTEVIGSGWETLVGL